MLLRFSLYGLLKNQRYFEAFLVLALVERGLSFTQIGVLVAVRALATNVLEVPSGVLADLLGRRRTMVAAFAAYVVAYLVLAVAPSLPLLAVGMLLIGSGDAFRSGTHKAMIFDWLAQQGRHDERVRIYGFTRSWSQVGSAIAAPIAAAVVFVRGGYADVFWLSAIPAAINLVNLATYPRALEGPRDADETVGEAARRLWGTARSLLPRRSLRRLLVEATAFTGLYRAVKDYLQPLVEGVALALPLLLHRDDAARSAMLVGAVYVLLFVLSAVASRHSHRVAHRAGSLDEAARWIRLAVVLTFGVMLAGLSLGWGALAIAAFVVLALVHSVFRPVLVGRFDEQAPAEVAATVLSVESQATWLGAIVLAPVIGMAIDAASGSGPVQLWPVAAVGLALSVLVAALPRPRAAASVESPHPSAESSTDSP